MPTFGQGMELSVDVETNGRSGGHAETVVTFDAGPGFLVGPDGEDCKRIATIHVIGSVERKALADALQWASDTIRLKSLAQGVELR